MAKSPQKNVGIIIFGVGLIALLVGAMTDLYSVTIGVLAALAIWIVGMPIIKLVMGGSKPKPEAEKSAIETPVAEEPKPAEPMPEEPKVEEIPPEEPPMEHPPMDEPKAE